MGAGKRLTLAQLQAQFGCGLKEAAMNLGICPTSALQPRRIERLPAPTLLRSTARLHIVACFCAVWPTRSPGMMPWHAAQRQRILHDDCSLFHPAQR